MSNIILAPAWTGSKYSGYTQENNLWGLKLILSILLLAIVTIVATTQPTSQNNLKQLLLGWYYYR